MKKSSAHRVCSGFIGTVAVVGMSVALTAYAQETESEDPVTPETGLTQAEQAQARADSAAEAGLDRARENANEAALPALEAASERRREGLARAEEAREAAQQRAAERADRGQRAERAERAERARQRPEPMGQRGAAPASRPTQERGRRPQ
jgi:transcription termination factor Rho